VISDYKASSEYKKLADTTKRQWAPWLDRIGEYFGDLRIAQFDRQEKIRPFIRRWRNQWADTPRTADYGLQVLSRVCAHAVDPLGKIGGNPCEGIKTLYSADRSEIIWTDADIAQLKAAASVEVGWAVDLAACTGLRRSDLLRVSWTHVENQAIVVTTSKSGHRLEAVIPIYDGLRSVLAAIPKRATTILTNTHGRPWTKDGFGTAIDREEKAAGLDERNLHFNDLRGTAATKLHIAGLPQRVIAEIMAWEEEHVARIIRRYVGRAAATKATIEQLNTAMKVGR